MGFWRGVGYFINILIILMGIVVANTTPFNIDIIIGFAMIFFGGIGIWFLRFYSLGESIDKNLQYLVDREREEAEAEIIRCPYCEHEVDNDYNLKINKDESEYFCKNCDKAVRIKRK